MLKIAILASGKGSNALHLKKIYQEHFGQKPLLLTDKKESAIAKEAEFIESRDFEKKLIDRLVLYQADWLFLAGFMKILSPSFIKEFANYHGEKNQIVNIHPSYLPDLKGLNAYERAFDSDRKETGISLHYVSPNVDSGEIIKQEKLMIDRSLAKEEWIENSKKREHKMFGQFLIDIISGKVTTSPFTLNKEESQLESL